MKLIVKYFNGQQFESFYEYVYSVENENEDILYKISVFVDDDGHHDSYIVNKQTGYTVSRKGFGLADCMTTVLSDESKTNPDAKLLMVSEA